MLWMEMDVNVCVEGDSTVLYIFKGSQSYSVYDVNVQLPISVAALKEKGIAGGNSGSTHRFSETPLLV